MGYLNVILNADISSSGMYGRRKEWIATAIGAGLSLASSLWGGKKASDAARKANRMIAAEKASNDAWFRRRYNEHYADTAAGQNLLRQAREYADKTWKKASGASKVAGATDESAALAKEAGNGVVAQTIGNVAAQDTSRKASVDAQHRSMDHALTQQQVSIEQNKAAQITNAAQNASNAMMNAGATLDYMKSMPKDAAQSGTSWNVNESLNNLPTSYYKPSNIIGTKSQEELENIIGGKG